MVIFYLSKINAELQKNRTKNEIVGQKISKYNIAIILLIISILRTYSITSLIR